MDTIDYFPIEVEQTCWNNARELLTDIRYQVFVEEQKVCIDEEIDENDPNAIHWLAYGPKDVPMATGRLLADGSIGRMAVLKAYRNRGVGASLMRHIIRYALEQSMNQLVLNAQVQAIPFYERFGFVIDGNEFIDAGIPHRPMVLNLHFYRDNTPQQPLPHIAESDRQIINLEGLDQFVEQVGLLVQRARRDIRILSHQLAIYNHSGVCDAIHSFARSHPHTRIRILVKDIPYVINHPNKLHELGQRLSSKIQIRKFFSKENCPHHEFVLIDRAGVLYQQEPERYVGYAIAHAPMEVVTLVDEFDELWEQGFIDPELRRLTI